MHLSSLSPAQALRRKHSAEGCPLPQLAVHFQLGSMALQRMLDDGQPQARAARIA